MIDFTIKYIKCMTNEDCNDALKRVFPKIDIDKISRFIDDIECMTIKRKEFNKKIINIRYKILKEVYEILI